MASRTDDMSNSIMLGMLLFGGIYLFRKNIGAALVAIPSDIAGSAVTEAGKIFGIPATNVTAGQAALASGDYFKASQLLPAADFISGIITLKKKGIDATNDPTVNDVFSQWAAANPALADQPAITDIFTQWAATNPGVAALPPGNDPYTGWTD